MPENEIYLHLFCFKESNQSSTELHYHVSTLVRRKCLTYESAVKPVMLAELQLSVC